MNRYILGFIWQAGISAVAVFSAAISIGARGQAGQEAQQKAAAILASAVEAAGGSAVAKVEGMELNTRRVAFLSGNSRGQSETDMRLIYPAQMRLEVKVMEAQTMGGYGGSGVPGSSGPVTPMHVTEHAGFAYVEGCDGTSWWRKMPKRADERPMDEGTQRRIERVGALGLYRRAAEGKLEAKFIGEQQIQGRQMQIVALSDGDTKLYFDPQIHLLAGVSHTRTSEEETFDAFHWWTDILKVTVQGAGREQTVWWSEYRRVKFKADGKEETIQFPYLWTSAIDGQKFMEERVTSLKVNAKQNPKIFAKPK